jgi:cellulose synthase/poly-beta-1,6-N-acetylglucosamine synthase-like glycosyltransferase
MYEKILLVLFICSFMLLWFSTFGYIWILRLLVFLKPHPLKSPEVYADIAVVIPTLNEENNIVEKIHNIELCDYPQNRLKVIVVDGGSTDRTVELVREKISRGKRIKLICLNESRGKVDQVNHILMNMGEEIIVFTDADSRLEPSCIRELVHTIMSDPETALVGATVKPKSKLIEEQIHWMFLNYIWWLEGEILSSAGISGVCYAVKQKMIHAIAQDAIAEDIHLGLDISARGYRVRICRRAIAYELRVPQTPREFVQFRRRRGASYINELKHSPVQTNPPIGWRLARFVRLWQFTWISWLSLATIVTLCFLLATRFWTYLFLPLIIFMLSAFLQISLLLNHSEKRPGTWALFSASFRFSIFTLVSLLSLKKIPSLLGPTGGKKGKYDKSSAA